MTVMRQAGVSGMGALSSIGLSVNDTRVGLFAPPPLPKRVRSFKTTLDLPVFELCNLTRSSDYPGGFTVELLAHALEEALAHAGLTAAELTGKRVGIAVGTSVACQLNNIPFYADLRAGKKTDRKAFEQFVSGSPAEWIRHRLGTRGPAVTISNACTSGADALGLAALWVRSGMCDLAIAGGADELNQVPLDGFHALGVCSHEPCRPFDEARAGLNLGEGAALIVLETAGHAAARGVEQHFALAGFGKASDAYHITAPHPEGAGLTRSIEGALKMAGIAAGEIALINAHGTGTASNDPVEALVFSRIFGDAAHYMSTKAMTGHTLGAAGALELVFCCLMLEAGKACRSWRFEAPGPDIPVAPLKEERKVVGDYALSTSLAFGGSNTALIVKRVGGRS